MSDRTRSPSSDAIARRELVTRAAREWSAIGAAPIPIKTHKDPKERKKSPSVGWKQFQNSAPTEKQIEHWFGSGNKDGLGIVTGFGGFELLEFETHKIYIRFLRAARKCGLRDLVGRLCDGYFARSPGGGMHLIYQCSEVGPSVVLAGTKKPYKRPDGHTTDVLIETRGTSGFAVLAPSGGPVHETGKPYAFLGAEVDGDGPYGAGGLSVVEITPEQRRELFALARSLDRRPPPEPRDRAAPTGETGRPGDDYNDRTEWPELMESEGWTLLTRRSDGTAEWRRPGKDSGSLSATTTHAGSDLLRVFSTSAAPLDAERSYDKFGFYAAVHHAGDHSAAAAALRAEGYGDTEDAEEREVQAEKRKLRIRERARLEFVSERAAAQLAESTGAVLDGAEFLTQDSGAEPEWGSGSQVLAARGEGTLIVGPQGVGKSTVAQQYMLRRIGLIEDDLFGFPVAVDDRPVLYLALDRPRQIARSLLRMVDVDDPVALALLQKRIRVYNKPLPFNPTEAPDQFADWIMRYGDDPGQVIVDSYKDVASGLIEDAVGAGLNSAMQRVLSRGVEWLGLHHQRKANVQNTRPDKLDDVYGSGWLTAGVGSVLLLWGTPGAPTVELRHLKQPMEPVGPLTVNHEHAEGVSVSTEPVARLCEVARIAADTGITEVDAAEALYGATESNDRKRARRWLNKLTGDGSLDFTAGVKGGSGGGGQHARWRWVS